MIAGDPSAQPLSMRRRLAWLTLAVGLVAAAPVNGQLIDPYQGSTQDRGAVATEQSTRTNATSQLAAPAAPVERYQPDQIDNPPNAESTTRAAAAAGSVVRPEAVASEFETYVSQIADKPVQRFGANLLVPGARDFTAAPTTTVPTDYRINPGDEVIIGLTGSVQADNLRVTVDSNGKIFVPRVGSINVAGVRYGDLQDLIAVQVSRQYRGFRIAVSVGQLHGITIYVTGFAAAPGSYTVSSLATLVNGVLSAGGPAAGGSFRAIELKRDGRLVSTFDLYRLLLDGDKSADVILQNGDVIYIAPAGPQVAVIGSINSDAIFEARNGDTLADVVRYAGGANTVADDSRLLVLDSVLGGAGGWEQLTPEQARTRIAKRGEILNILSGVGIAQPLNRQPVLVTVSGEVAKPGRYYLKPGTRINDVIEEAGGLTDQAYPFATVFTRESLRLQQRLNYSRAIADVEFLLTTQPLLSTTGRDQSQPERLAAVRSAVAQLAARKPDGRLVFDIVPSATVLPGRLTLENNDTIYVPPTPVTVGVFGAVTSPASFEFVEGATIGSFLARAGDVQPAGDRAHVFVVRANGSLLSARRGSFKRSVLAERALPGDLIFVPLDTRRGELWAKIRDLTSILFTGAISAAAIAVASR